MAKEKTYQLTGKTDIKVFILFILDTIRYPVDYTTLIEIIFDNTEALSIDYEECLGELVDGGHVYFDEYEGERFYMISEEGREVATALYDSLDPVFLERSVKSTAKHLSLQKSGTKIRSGLHEKDGRYEVKLEANDRLGELFTLTLSVGSREEGERIRQNFETHPDSVYRGLLFAATGRLGYFSE